MEAYSNGNNNSEASSSSMNNLFCEEDISCLGEEDEHTASPQLPNSQLVLDDSVVNGDDDYVQMLVQRERISPSISSSNYPSWLKTSRFFAIDWIINTTKSRGFQNQTAYLSVRYLDQFLSRTSIRENHSWAMSLLSLACLSIAIKMDECEAPALEVYQAENHEFRGELIQEMEIMVLNTLEWRMSLITPFAYIHYFIRQLGVRDSEQDELFSKVTDLILALIKESNSIEDYRPFVVAAAAVMAAFDWQLTQEMLIARINTVPLWESSNNIQKQQEEEQLVACYTLMQRFCSNNNNLATPNSSEVHQNGNSPRLSGRKRSLTFRITNHDPHIPD